MRQQDDDAQVAVVGGGPAGLTAAIALARAGVETVLFERRPLPSSAPRATAISTATMELMRSWGLEGRLREGELDVELRPWISETLADAGSGWAVDAGFPTREQSALVSPTSPAGIPQSHLEPVLEEHLLSLGARVERGVEVVSVAGDPDGVTVAVRGPAPGRMGQVRARYLIAGDGIRSTVRDALQIPLNACDDLGERLVVLFTGRLWDLLGELRYTIYGITGAGQPCFFVPAGLPDRWVFGAERDPRLERAEDLARARLADLIRRAAGDPEFEPRIEHIGTVSYGVHLADRFRDGRVFLIGDAAHRVTPRGATGLNTAIRDGYDLGWKLAWVVRGWADERLLDTYETERRPVAEHNVARSADPNGSEADVARELRTDLGGRIAHIWLPADAGRTSALDLIGEGLTLLTGPGAGAWRAAAASIRAPMPLAVRRLDELTARALGVTGRGALLVRTDGHPFALWAGEAGAAARLSCAIDAVAAGGDLVPGPTTSEAASGIAA